MKLKKRVITSAAPTMESFGSVCVAAESAFDGSVADAPLTISDNEAQAPAEITEENAAEISEESVAEIAQENAAEESADREIACETEEAKMIHEGTDGDLSWSIDAQGHLVIEGEGNYDYGDWKDYYEDIKTAEVNVTGITSTAFMFSGCESLGSVDLSELNTDKVTNMSGMFYRCCALNSVDVSGFNTGNVTDMSYMFRGCYTLSSVDVSGFNTEKVTDMSSMFMHCKSLSSVDVSGFNTGNVANMSYMLWQCESLSKVDLSGLDTRNVTDMRGMFSGCFVLSSVDVSGFNTERVTDISDMFKFCESLTTMRFPASLKMAVKLPWNEDYHWKDETGKVCTYAFAGLSTPVTYVKCEGNVEPKRETVDSGTDGASGEAGYTECTQAGYTTAGHPGYPG